MHTVPRAPLRASGPAATRCPGPTRSPPGERGRASWSPRSAAERELGDHPAERAMRAPGRGPARALPRRRGRARRRRLRALAAGGRLRRGRGAPSARRSRSTAGACTGRSTASTAPPTGRALVLDYKLSGSVTPREQARGGGEAAAAALPDRRRRALGRGAGRRPLPPAARDLGAPPARGSSSRTPPTSSPAYGICRDRRRRRARASRSCSTTPGGAPARSSPGCAPATIRPRPRAAARPARPRRLPRLLRLRADLPPRPGPGRADRRGRRGGER